MKDEVRNLLVEELKDAYSAERLSRNAAVMIA